MAASDLQSTGSLFYLLVFTYLALAGLRLRAMNEEAAELLEAHIDPAFWVMARAPAPTASMVALKGECILKEYGETREVRSDLVELLLDDVRRLI